VEASALDRGALDHGPLLAAEPVDTSREQCLHRRRHDQLFVQTAVLGVESEQLLDEERIPLGGLHDSPQRRDREGRVHADLLDQRPRFLLG
jgi:hypothetical protein